MILNQSLIDVCVWQAREVEVEVLKDRLKEQDAAIQDKVKAACKDTQATVSWLDITVLVVFCKVLPLDGLTSTRERGYCGKGILWKGDTIPMTGF